MSKYMDMDMDMDMNTMDKHGEYPGLLRILRLRNGGGLTFELG